MKKIISLFSAVAVVATMFASFATTSFAATSADSKPEIQGTVESVDGDGYAIMKFKLVNNEDLSYALNRGKITSNGINAIQVKLTLDETVFDVSESYISGGFTGVNVSGDGAADKTFVFAPTSVDSYMTSVPEYLFQVDALLKDGYTFENIPSSAVTFGATKVEYTSYAGVAASAGATTYTIYGTAGTFDYPLTVAFTGTATEDDDDEEEEEKATTMDTPVAGKDMYGMKTALTKISFKNVANPVVKLEKDNVDSGKTYELPSNVKGGEVDIIGIIRYAADVTGTFVLSVFDGETEVASTSYVAE